jgi:Glycosyl transferases group 1
MRILFVAKHMSGDNDDEGAVAHALRELGHEVDCVQEQRWKRQGDPIERREADFCLFFKWPTVSELIETSKRMPCFFWYFDMVEPVDGDHTLHARSLTRIQWMLDVMPHVKLGFCTDGDWVAKMGGNLRWLMQGFDERQKHLLEHSKVSAAPQVMFAGMVNHGQKRLQHIASLQEKYQDNFVIFGNRGPRGRIHGRTLAQAFAATKVVVAPDGPSTDRYWSNRVYLTTGLGGFLVHPYCAGLAEQYPEHILPMYEDRAMCEGMIDAYLKDNFRREAVRRLQHEYTIAKHLYRHRVEEMLKQIKEVL